MKYISSNTKAIFEINPEAKMTTCPECSHNRRKKEDKCVKWYNENESAYCFHCETSFHQYVFKETIEYIVPKAKNETKLSEKALKFFTGRGISQKTINKLGIYSDKEFMPQFDKDVDVICFPFYLDDKIVNIKYRGANKAFKLHQGAELIFYNINAIKNNVVIVEGEIDALSVIEAGSDNVISVPNGASKNLDYLDAYIDKFEKCEQIFLATDNDKKGIELRDELARRLGKDKCYIVDFKDCKDANEYLTAYGALELLAQISRSKGYPIKGVVKVDDFYAEIRDLYDNGIQRGEIIGSDIDQFISWETGRFGVITGIPSHGKSEFVDWLLSEFNRRLGWKAALFTPENYPLKFHYRKLFEKFIGSGMEREKSNEEEFQIGYEYIRKNFFYIIDEEDNSIDLILEGAKSLIKSKGIKVLVIDPFNKIEHQLNRGESETLYISRLLDTLTSFARFNDILILLVAHPRKMQKNGAIYEVPNLYDISGSAHFYNKADYGITVYRLMNEDCTGFLNTIQAHVQKVKFKHLGSPGMIELNYNYNNGRFENLSQDIMDWDNSNWLIN